MHSQISVLTGKKIYYQFISNTNLSLKINTAAKAILSKYKSDHVSPLCKNLQQFPVATRRKHKLLSLISKAYHNLTSLYLSRFLSHYSSANTLCFSQTDLIVLPQILPSLGIHLVSVYFPPSLGRQRQEEGERKRGERE